MDWPALLTLLVPAAITAAPVIIVAVINARSAERRHREELARQDERYRAEMELQFRREQQNYQRELEKLRVQFENDLKQQEEKSRRERIADAQLEKRELVKAKNTELTNLIRYATGLHNLCLRGQHQTSLAADARISLESLRATVVGDETRLLEEPYKKFLGSPNSEEAYKELVIVCKHMIMANHELLASSAEYGS